MIKTTSYIALSVALSSLSFLSYKYYERKRKLRMLKLELEASARPDSEELIREQLTRNSSFFGDAQLHDIRDAFVIIVGLGGVGSHAAVHLVRSGVSRMRIIDFDQVTLSSLNRHASAVRSDVGTPKVLAIKRYCQQIFPACDIDARATLFSLDKADELMAGQPTFVIDCIDNIQTKVELIKYCTDNNIKIVSSMGSACKLDPSRVRMCTLDQTCDDKLARAVRYKLRKDHGMETVPAIPVIYSSETPKVSMLPLHQDAQQDPGQFALLPSFRVRILPVCSPVPAMFGAALAALVLSDVGKFQIDADMRRHNHKLCSKLLNELYQRYEGTDVRDYIAFEEVSELFELVWNHKCAIAGQVNNLVLRVWDENRPPRMDNLVLICKSLEGNLKSLDTDVSARIKAVLDKTKKEIPK